MMSYTLYYKSSEQDTVSVWLECGSAVDTRVRSKGGSRGGPFLAVIFFYIVYNVWKNVLNWIWIL